MRRLLLTAALLLLATSAYANTILQFSEFTFNTPFTFSENVADTVTTITASTHVNVTFDHTLCLVAGCGGVVNGDFLLTLNATSAGAATVAAGAVTQPFGGTIAFTNGGVNLLTVSFSDLLQGSLGGSNPTLQSSQPPDIFSGTSNVLDPNKIGIPRGFALSFSNLSNGGLGVVGTSVRSGTADATGTFNATPVPEPASLLLLGGGLIGLAGRIRRRLKK